MKKFLLSIMLLVLMIMLTACFQKRSNKGVFGENNEKIADNTFKELISAVQLKDASEIVNLFSNTTKSKIDLTLSAASLVDYVQGDIVSLSSAVEAGVGADLKTENGKTKKEIQSSFCINTTEATYYIAIKECVKDEINHDNIGLLSMYIIESTNWAEDYVYRGDGKWTLGINIVDSQTVEDKATSRQTNLAQVAQTNY